MGLLDKRKIATLLCLQWSQMAYSNLLLLKNSHIRKETSRKKIDFIGAILLLMVNVCFVTGISPRSKKKKERADGKQNKGVLGYHPSFAALWIFPRALLVAFDGFCSGHHLSRTGHKRFIQMIMSLQILVSLGAYLWQPRQPRWYHVLCLGEEGFVFGVVFVATMVALVVDIEHQETASATFLMFLFRSGGWLSGSAIAAAIMQFNFKSILYQSIQGPKASDLIEFVRSSITKKLPFGAGTTVQLTVLDALYQSIHIALLFVVVTSVISWIATFGLKK
ncbi:hypothetical protein BD560DRAFT_469603 [Blakeslea trispora]|nr:hypothetical protein BD560DRAFT_469603 [Blakeslea trispora]